MTRLTKKEVTQEELDEIIGRLEEKEVDDGSNSNYINNKELQQEFLKYEPAKQAWIEGGKEGPPPPLPESIGSAIIQIATRRSYSPRFIKYTQEWKEEMIQDAILTCVKYVHNYDPSRFDNPFAYITQFVNNEFFARLRKEYKQDYVKLKTFDAAHGMLADLDENNLSEDDIQSLNETNDIYKDRLDRIANYEDLFNLNKKRKSRKKKGGMLDD